MLCQAINSIFWMLLQAVFISFGRQITKKFWETLPPESLPGPCHGSARGLTAPPDPQLLFVLCTFHTHIIWVSLALPMLTFFSVLTPENPYDCLSPRWFNPVKGESVLLWTVYWCWIYFMPSRKGMIVQHAENASENDPTRFRSWYW